MSVIELESRELDALSGFWADARYRLRRNPGAIAGFVLVGFFVATAIFAPLIAPFNPRNQDLALLANGCCPGPSLEHWFGVDDLGRDEFSRILYGARFSLVIGVVSVSIGLTIGLILGAIAGYLGGLVDSVIMRMMDIMLAIPGLLLAIGIVTMLGPGLFQVMIAVGVTSIPIFARLLRGSVLASREQEFVVAARAAGVKRRWILVSHILPNAISPVIVQGTLALATAIIDAAGLGFLGLGPQDPATPEWGTMLTFGVRHLQSAPHLAIIPGVAIVISVLGFNLIGDALREVLDPKLRGQGDRPKIPAEAGRTSSATEGQRADAAETLLEVDGLRIEFWTRRGTIHAVNGVSFSVSKGETLGIVGESGCGKSVTSLALLGILPRAGRVVAGRAFFEGRDLLQLPDKELRRIRGREIAMIFQDPMTSLNPVLTIGRQIVEPLEAHFGLERKQAEQQAVELLEQVGIPSAKSRARDYPHQFSGGMRQRAMIAMALACKPKLLVADEPTTALDVTIQAQILTLLRELVVERDAALILITHDLGVIAGMCERVNVMYAGLFVETGSADQIFGSPRHPYTLGLLESVPRLDAARGRRLQPIEGMPRDMLRPPTACPFQPRCRFEVVESREKVPPLIEAELGHKVACFNPVPADEWVQKRSAGA